MRSWVWMSISVLLGLTIGYLLPSPTDLAIERMRRERPETMAPFCSPINNGDILVWNEERFCWDGVSIGSLSALYHGGR